MRCQEARSLIYTYIDGCLAGQVERAFFGHLSQCEYCQQELEYARQTHALLEKYCTPVEPPADFVDQVMAAIDGALSAQQEDTQELPKKAAAPVQGFKSFRRWAQVASVALLMAAVSLSSWLNGGFQLARTPTPEPFNTNFEAAEERTAEEHQGKNPSAGGSGPVQEAGNVDGENVIPPAAGEAGIKEEPSNEVNPAKQENTGEQKDIKNIEEQKPAGEQKPDQGFEVAQVTPPEIPIPEQEIMAPVGPFKAAHVEKAETLKSVSLEKIPLANVSRPGSGIFVNQTLKFLSGNPGDKLNIWALEPNGGSPRLLGETAKTVNGTPVWSLDGQRLAYLHQNSQGISLYIDDLTGGAIRVAPAEKEGEIKFPVWSTKGEITYLLAGGRDNHIVVSNGQDSTLVAATGSDCGPVWSPDGTQIAYGKNGSLHIVQRDGTQDKAVANLEGKLQGIAWSPGSSKIAVSVKGSNNRNSLWVGHPSGNNWEKVAEVGGGRILAWSPDGSKIAFTDAQGGAYLMTFTTQGSKGELYPITPDQGSGGVKALSWTGDAKELVVEWAPAQEAQGLWKAILP